MSSAHSALSTGHSALSLILASGSPRRRELLADAGFAFEVIPADVNESDYPPGTLPGDLAELLAIRKATVLARSHPDRLVLGADTVVALGPTSIGKPLDAADAVAMLRRLAGSTHQVITGVCLASAGGSNIVSEGVVSTVQMKPLSDRQIADYVATDQWRGKAGGYGIQDQHADPFIERLGGSYTNIMGLPMECVTALLAAAGVVPSSPNE